MLAQLIDKTSTRTLLILAAGLSLGSSLLSVWRTPTLSYDSLLYLETAEAFMAGGLQQALEVYPWPFLSVFIATLHQLTGLSLATCGHLLTSLAYAGILVLFIHITRVLGGSSRVQWWAALVLLILPTLNDYRGYIIRDPLFWLLLLVSLEQLVRYQQNQRLCHAGGWVLSIALATLFRLEALVFALLAPLFWACFSAGPWRARLTQSLPLYAGLGVLGALGFGFLLIFSWGELGQLRLVDELRQIPQFFSQTAAYFEMTLEQIKQGVHNPFIADDIKLIFISGLIGLVLFTSLHAFSVPYLLVITWRVRSYGAFLARADAAPLCSYLLITLCYLTLFAFKAHFLTDRFFISFALVALLPLPFILDQIMQGAPQRWHLGLLALLFSYQLLDSSISTGPTKTYLAEANHWLQKEQAGKQILSDQEHIAYFAGQGLAHSYRENALALIESGQKTDLLIVDVRRKQQTKKERLAGLEAAERLQPLQRFANERDNELRIYRVIQAERQTPASP